MSKSWYFSFVHIMIALILDKLMNKFSLFINQKYSTLFELLGLDQNIHQMMIQDYHDFLEKYNSLINNVFLDGEYKQVIEYCEFLLELVNQVPDEYEKTQLEYSFYSYYNAAKAHSNLHNVEKSYHYAVKGVEIAQLLSDDIKLGDIAKELGKMYEKASNVNEAYKYFKICIDAGLRSNNSEMLADAYDSLSRLYLSISDFGNALALNELALIEYRKLQDYLNEAGNIGTIGVIYYYMNDWDRAKEYFQIAYDECVKHQFKEGMSKWFGNIGSVYAEIGKYELALEHYTEAVNICREIHADEKIGIWKGNIADLYFDMKKYDEAIPLYLEAIKTLENYESLVDALHFKCQYSRLFSLQEIEIMSFENALGFIMNCLEMSREYGLKKEEYLSHSVLSGLYEKHALWEKALHHHKEYVTIKQVVHSKEIEESARNFDFGRKLQKMEEERSLELARLHQKETMLHDLLPGGISDRIINGEELVAELYENIAIMFCDIVGFTEISERLGPELTIRSLNTFYTSYDAVIQEYGIEKIKTIGDCYMAASGLFDRESDYLLKIMLCAADILKLTKELTFIDGTPLQVRIGLHAGNVMAGVLGDKKYTFDVWGDTVNTSARMESYGQPGFIQISNSMMSKVNIQQIPKLQVWTEQVIQIKGKGAMKTVLLKLIEQ